MDSWLAGLRRPQKPRVSKCDKTNKWIVNKSGWRHHCGSGSYKSDEAFRHWRDAVDIAVSEYEDRLRAFYADHQRFRRDDG